MAMPLQLRQQKAVTDRQGPCRFVIPYNIHHIESVCHVGPEPDTVIMLVSCINTIVCCFTRVGFHRRETVHLKRYMRQQVEMIIAEKDERFKEIRQVPPSVNNSHILFFQTRLLPVICCKSHFSFMTH